jgi:hypothetical protein
MITYIISSFLIIGFSAIAVKSAMKNRRHKKKQLDIAQAYDKLVRECKLAIDYSEFLCYRYIGLDRRNKKLVLIDHCKNNKQEICISLAEIGESKILHIKDESQNVKTIFLELRSKRNNQPVRFCFYDKDHDADIELPSLSRKAIHWKTKVDIHKHPGNVSLEAEYVL